MASKDLTIMQEPQVQTTLISSMVSDVNPYPEMMKNKIEEALKQKYQEKVERIRRREEKEIKILETLQLLSNDIEENQQFQQDKFNQLQKELKDINKENIVEEITKTLDMAFMFAEPLVEKVEGKGAGPNDIRACQVPLDIDQEYKQLELNLKRTERKFCILKQAVNHQTLQNVIGIKPKILHLSCHGAKDEEKKDKFNLFFEEIGNGHEDKFSETRLKTLLGISDDKRNKIELVFVSACQSDQIGKTFINAKIPAVISVDHNQNIQDDCARLFSATLYKNLLIGKSIINAFNSAKKEIFDQIEDNFEVCCCAHDHSDDCKWYKKYGKNLIEGHKQHLQWGKCSDECKQQKSEKPCNKQHLKECPKYVNFREDMKKLEIEIKDDGIICCCDKKRNEAHNESMKFKIEYCKEKYKHRVLFSQREKGDFESFEEVKKDVYPIIRYNQQKNIEGLYGRNLLLHKLIKFLTSKETLDKIVNLVGPSNSGKQQIGYYAMNYCMDRNFFVDGALAINCNNFKLCKEMYQDISNKVGMLSNDESDIIEKIKELNIVVMLFDCDQILKKTQEQSKFYQFLRKVAEQTQNIKIIYFENKISIFDTMDYRMKQSTKIIDVQSITNEDAKELFLKLIELKENDFPDKAILKETFDGDGDQKQFTPIAVQMLATIYQKEKNLKNISQKLQENDGFQSYIYETIKKSKDYKQFLKSIYFISFSKGGLYHIDIQHIIEDNDLQKWMQITSKEEQQSKLNTHLILQSEDPDLIMNYSLRGNFDEYLTSLDHEERIIYFKEYVQFMSDQSRIIVRGQENYQFDPHVLSTSIDHGIWDSNSKTLHKEENYEKQCLQEIQDIESVYFEKRKQNFFDLIEILISDKYMCSKGHKMNFLFSTSYKAGFAKDDHCQKSIDTSKGYYNCSKCQEDYHAHCTSEFKIWKDVDFKEEDEEVIKELLVNISTLLIIQKNYKDAMKLIEQGLKYCEKELSQRIQTKKLLMMMKISILIKIDDFSMDNNEEKSKKTLIKKSKKKEKEIKELTIEEMLNNFETIPNLNEEEIGELNFLRALYFIHNMNIDIAKNDDDIDFDEIQENWENDDMFSHLNKNTLKKQNSVINQKNNTILDPIKLKSRLSVNVQPQEVLYKELLKFFELSRENYGPNTLGYAKSIYVQAEALLFFYDLQKDDSRKRNALISVLQGLQGTSDSINKISEATKIFKDLKYNFNQYKCILNNARIHMISKEKDDYKLAINILNECMDSNDTLIIDLAQKLLPECHIAVDFYRNLFVYAQSFPIKKESQKIGPSEPIIFHSNLNFEKDLLKEIESTKNYVEVSFETLNRQFLDDLKDREINILVLNPYVFKQIVAGQKKEIQQMCVEDHEFLTAEKLKEFYKTSNLKINILILQSNICKSFAKVFKELGISTVIHFHKKQKRKHHDKKNLKKEKDVYMKQKLINENFAIDKVSHQFSIEFSKQILNKKQVYEAFQAAKKHVQIDQNDYVSIELLHDDNSNQRNSEIQKKVAKGVVIKLNKIEIPSNIKSAQMFTFFNNENYKIFSQIVNGLLQEDNKKNFHIQGPCGAGTHQMFQNIAVYLKQRAYFQNGIYKINIEQIDDRNKFINKILPELEKKSLQAMINGDDSAQNQILIVLIYHSHKLSDDNFNQSDIKFLKDKLKIARFICFTRNDVIIPLEKLEKIEIKKMTLNQSFMFAQNIQNIALQKMNDGSMNTKLPFEFIQQDKVLKKAIMKSNSHMELIYMLVKLNIGNYKGILEKLELKKANEYRKVFNEKIFLHTTAKVDLVMKNALAGMLLQRQKTKAQEKRTTPQKQVRFAEFTKSNLSKITSYDLDKDSNEDEDAGEFGDVGSDDESEEDFSQLRLPGQMKNKTQSVAVVRKDRRDSINIIPRKVIRKPLEFKENEELVTQVDFVTLKAFDKNQQQMKVQIEEYQHKQDFDILIFGKEGSKPVSQLLVRGLSKSKTITAKEMQQAQDGTDLVKYTYREDANDVDKITLYCDIGKTEDNYKIDYDSSSSDED